jgi:E3 ubiquitin-protein ligase RNF1/2
MRIDLNLASRLKDRNHSAHINGSKLPSLSSSSTNTKDPIVRDLTIHVASVPGQLTQLRASLSLTQVNEKYWKVNKPMEMFYSFKRT